MEDDDIAPLGLVEIINNLVYQELLAVVESEVHTRSFHNEFLNDKLQYQYYYGRNYQDCYCITNESFDLG